MKRPRLLDLFCGAGGAAMGYHRAGFDVVGVDINPQPHYPFPFRQADALAVLRRPLGGLLREIEFDAIHASPPCKASTRTGWAYRFGYHANHANLIGPTRELLQASGLPWVMENVPGADLNGAVQLCGSMFNLGVRRHRWFECSWDAFMLLPPCDHRRYVVSPHGNPNKAKGTRLEWARAMELPEDWPVSALNQAIPPAYTEFIGAQLIEAVSQ